jgi:hypothetical protein
VALLLFMLGLGVLPASAAQSFRDHFTNRITISNLSGKIEQSNAAATVEPGEPRHGGKTGGRSLWISWLAVSNGVIKMKTETSGFDTLLSAYQFTNGAGTTFADLREVARADDSEGLDHESEVEFGVRAGEQYEIAVDGYFGAAGLVEFEWEFKHLTVAPAQILNTLADRSVNLGDTVTLTFLVTNAAAGRFKWYHNSNEVDDAEASSLTITGFTLGDVGRYKLRVETTGAAAGSEYFSVPVNVQINTEDIPTTLAQDKLLDGEGTALIGEDGEDFAPRPKAKAAKASLNGVVRGYNGSQIFDTTFATLDPGEPDHCGVTTGASFWLFYIPPTNGTVTLDTAGSSFDTVLAVYTYNSSMTSYADLIPVNCDNDGLGPQGQSFLEFAAIKTRTYVIVVAGVNNARGRARLNYSLDVARPPVPPTLLQLPAQRIVAPGANVVLQPAVTGSSPLLFAWKKGVAPLSGATNLTLNLTNVSFSSAADYVVTISNLVGASIDVTLPLRVVLPTQVQFHAAPGLVLCTFPTVQGQSYMIEQAGDVAGPWEPASANLPGSGGSLTVSNAFDAAAKFFRVRVQ